jgi:hypothetical protein
MSDTTNHKKAIAITRSCRGNRGLITDIYYKILEDHPAAIVNAYREIGMERSGKEGKFGYVCGGCKKTVGAIGMARMCMECDPSGFDVPY